MEWLAVVLVVLAVILVIWSCRAARHEVYDDGSGGVKIRCPGEEQRNVYGSVVICPFCGVKLEPPKRRYRWEKR